VANKTISSLSKSTSCKPYVRLSCFGDVYLAQPPANKYYDDDDIISGPTFGAYVSPQCLECYKTAYKLTAVKHDLNTVAYFL